MKTGLGKRFGYRATTAMALTAAVALPLLLSGCEDHSPVTAPTSTLPAQDPSTGSPGADPQPTVPAYETDLELSPEETEAAEGALVALDEFVDFTNHLYGSGGEELAGANKVATRHSLKEVNQAAKTMADQSKSMVGKVTVERRAISNVDLNSQDQIVQIQACSPSRTYHFVTPEQTEPAQEDTGNPEFEFTILLSKNSWKVAKQTWIREECDS